MGFSFISLNGRVGRIVIEGVFSFDILDSIGVGYFLYFYGIIIIIVFIYLVFSMC